VKRLRTYATLLALSLVLGFMVGITSYSVTLYRLFCQVTGANGTTQRALMASAVQARREVTVLFDTNVAPGMPWRFVPVQRSVKLHLGQDALVFFEAQNLSDHDITGHAAFNVTPEKAGIYFKKIQCFCFTEEKLAAGAKVQMPVDFFVDPALGTDPGTADVHEITLSYTFFESKKPQGAPDLSRFVNAAPNAGAGAQLFAEQCSACHELYRAKLGPALAGVVGRQAGSVAGYPYSAALKAAGFVWDTARLEQWLADPQAYVPGALMPMKVDVPQARRDIVAYLQTVPAVAAVQQPAPVQTSK
jgi:cytochrome c oxidase assembly protein subunit 11